MSWYNANYIIGFPKKKKIKYNENTVKRTEGHGKDSG
jgi:hypothetical protein